MTTETQTELQASGATHGRPEGNATQAELDTQCREVQDAIDGGFEATLKAILKLEHIKWEGHWTHDEWWSRELNEKTPRTFNSWMAGVRGFTIDGEPLDKDTYQRGLRTALLHQGIKVENAKRKKEGTQILPYPRNYTQARAYASLFVREDELPKSFDSWVEEFKVPSAASGANTYEPPYLAPSDQTDVLTAWESSWQQMGESGYDQRMMPKPPSQRWSERCLQAGARSTETFKPAQSFKQTQQAIVQETPEARESRLEKERAAAKRTQNMLRELVATKKERELRSEVDRIKAEQHKKEAAELAEIRTQCREYCEAMTAAYKGVHTLLVKLRSIDSTKGTVYLNELRAFDNGWLSVNDDLKRIKEIGTEFQEIIKLVDPANAGYATGISFAQTVNQDGSSVDNLRVID